jgi:hypothetical protein
MKTSKKNLTQMGNMFNLPTVKPTQAPDGVKANLTTVQMMKEIAREESGDPLVRQLALNIINHKEVKSHQYIDEARAIAEWVQENIPYVKDARNIEQIHSPTMLIKRMQRGEAVRGDCDDMSLFLATLLLSIGHAPMFKCVRFKKTEGSYNHIYVIERNKNHPKPFEMIIMDCIVKDKDIGYEVKYLSSDVFEI